MSYLKSILAVTMAAGLIGTSQAQMPVETIGAPMVVQSQNLRVASSIATQFQPKARTDKRRLDYSVWDEMLHKIVVDFGPSSRIRSPRPRRNSGTRVNTGHSSPYRLEGSRVAFGFLNDNYKGALSDYRKDLVEIANTIDIQSLSRDEQLAFWFNLHNVLLIEKISGEYPEDVPSTLIFETPDGQAGLHDAKFINIRGVDLSLRNIREDIVFSNWSDPIVLYGFFQGDIGSPKMLRSAFTGANLEYRLNGNAHEFVNSLRGFHETSRSRKVSAIYEDASKFFFKNWDVDLSAHIKQFAEGDTLEDFNSGKPFEVDKYETTIADLSGGQRRASALFVEGSGNLSPDAARLLSEVGQKQEILRRRGVYSGKNNGYVIIEDSDTKKDVKDGETIN